MGRKVAIPNKLFPPLNFKVSEAGTSQNVAQKRKKKNLKLYGISEDQQMRSRSMGSVFVSERHYLMPLVP